MWAITVWTTAHTAAGIIMLGYCFVGMVYEKLTPRYEADLWNTMLFRHFHALLAVIACGVIGLLPRLLAWSSPGSIATAASGT